MWLPDRQTDRQTRDKVIPMCRYASQVTQKGIDLARWNKTLLLNIFCNIHNDTFMPKFYFWTFSWDILITRHVFVKHGCPRQQHCKIFKSYILTPQPQGHGMSVKCEQPSHELTVQVWFLYEHQNFKYCTFFVSRTELRTNRQTIQTLDAPSRPFRPGA